ncbi:hypothetical protein OKT77_26045 [Bacillus anthracis]|uniref:hypothetical protein n=1 Tax=Bacillus anthracis TaxID=1392 RepID=UPI00226F9ABC|nr:hypothetical protein [Bacillus anthracis]MCX9102998.1 hypothetical protein [Bacillus anthracis]
MGVYVVFDMFDGKDWCTPNDPDLLGKSRKCLYVGEGQIKTRLTVNKNRYGLHAGEIIYYEIPTIEDRLLFEKILIKHYQPISNKENYFYHPDVTRKYTDSLKKFKNHIINEISGIAEYKEIDLDAESFCYYLYDDLDWSLGYIDTINTLELKGDITTEVKTYLTEMYNFSKLNPKSPS